MHPTIYLYGITLTASHPTVIWDPVNDIAELDMKQAILGPESKLEEYNIVQAEMIDFRNEIIKIPLAILKANETPVMQLHRSFFPAPVKFTLLLGSGPVHMIGKQHLPGVYERKYYFNELEAYKHLNNLKNKLNDKCEDTDSEEDGSEPEVKKAKIAPFMKPKGTMYALNHHRRRKIPRSKSPFDSRPHRDHLLNYEQQEPTCKRRAARTVRFAKNRR